MSKTSTRAVALLTLILALTFAPTSSAQTYKGAAIAGGSGAVVGSWQAEVNTDKGRVYSLTTNMKSVAAACGTGKTTFSSFDVSTTTTPYGDKHRVFRARRGGYNLIIRLDQTSRGWRYFGGSLEPRVASGNSCLLTR